MKQFLKQIYQRFQKIPLPIRIGSGFLLLAVAYTATFIIPSNVQLSYASSDVCARWVTVAPDLQRQRAGSDQFSAKPADVVSVFGVPILSKSVCFTPIAAPDEGRDKVSVSPYGMPFFSKTFGISMPAKPSAKLAGLQNGEISAVKPLMIPLSTRDEMNTYTLRYGEKQAACAPKDTGVLCTISQLDLDPSTTYGLSLYRHYKNTDSTKIETVQIRTLSAVQMGEASIKNDAVVYDIPADFRFTFDRQLDDVTATLERTGESTTNVAIDATVEGTVVVISPKEPLARNAGYRLVLEQVTGKDGSSLAVPIATAFTLSGGPKVSDVSIGTSTVSRGASVIVTFDQPLKKDIDISKFARSSGVGSTVSRVSDTSIAFALSSEAPLCTAFSLIVDKGVASGSNNEVSTDAWKFDSRIICGYASTIGYSVKGRAITSYTFGSGGSTILFTGGMHGSEPSGTTTMQAWVSYLQAYRYKIPSDKKVVIVPNTNPDGIASGSRNNANNVNIDRNFPASNWRPDIDTASGTLPTGGGTSAGSEPETKALIALVRQLRPVLEVSFHAQGSLVGANQFGNSVSVGTNYANMVGYATMIGNAEEVMGYSITGEFEDWMGQEMGIPAILIELPRSSGNYFTSQLQALLKTITL